MTLSRRARRVLAVCVAIGAALLLAAVVLPIVFLLSGEVPEGDRETAFAYHEAFSIARRTPEGVEYTVNNSTASFDADVEDPDEHGRRVFKSYADALRYCRDRGLTFLPSVQLVLGKCKQLDDSVCAALEAAVQRGIEPAGFAGKRRTLQGILARLLDLRGTSGLAPEAAAHFDEAVAHVAGALSLGGQPPHLGPELAARVAVATSEFLRDEVQSLPIGFWAEREDLREICAQDRFLMQGLPLDRIGSAVAIALALAADPSLLDALERLQRFDAAITNPLVSIDANRPFAPEDRLVPWRELVGMAVPPGASIPEALAAAGRDGIARIREEVRRVHGDGASFALVSWSASKEYALLRALGREGRPQGSTMDRIIEAVRSGRLSLEPSPGAGWYDHQLHALETLLLPERGRESVKVSLSDAYRGRLQNAFATTFTKARETHVKHLPILTLCKNLEDPDPPPRVEVGPELSVEPTATVYLRQARAYRFLRKALEAVIGEEGLRAIRRESGPASGKGIDEDLDQAARMLSNRPSEG